MLDKILGKNRDLVLVIGVISILLILFAPIIALGEWIERRFAWRRT